MFVTYKFKKMLYYICKEVKDLQIKKKGVSKMKYDIYYKVPYDNTEYVMQATSTHMMKTFVELLKKEQCRNITVYEIAGIKGGYHAYQLEV